MPDILKTIFRSVYSQKEIKETLEDIELPENATSLKPVQINKEIYSVMTEKECKHDEPLKYIANAISKAPQPLAYAWSSSLSTEVSVRNTLSDDVKNKNIIIHMTDDLSLDLTEVIKNLDTAPNIIGMASSQMVQNKKMDLRFKFAWDCHNLVGRSVPFTDFLFGDNLKKSAINARKEKSFSRGVADKNGKFILHSLHQEFQSFLVKKVAQGATKNKIKTRINTSISSTATTSIPTASLHKTRTSQASYPATLAPARTSSPGAEEKAGAKERAENYLPSNTLFKYPQALLTCSWQITTFRICLVQSDI